MSTKLPLPSPARETVPADYVLKWRKRLDEEFTKERHAILTCLGVGLLLNGIVLAAGLMLGALAVRVNPQPHATDYLVGLALAAGICIMMLIVAALTKPNGRAETARQFFDMGTDQAVAHNHPEGALVFSVAIVIALYGSFAIVEASRRIRMRIKLAKVDRDQTARMLAEICNVPIGIHWKKLLLPGQHLQSLRGPIALLLLNGWIQIEDHGQTLVQRTPAMRRALYRHPLAEVFPVVES